MFEEVIDNEKCHNFLNKLILANSEWVIYPDIERPNVLYARNLKYTTIQRKFKMNDKITGLSHINKNIFLITTEPNLRHYLLRIDIGFFAHSEKLSVAEILMANTVQG